MISGAEEVIHETAILTGAVGGLMFVMFAIWVLVRRPWRTLNAKFGKLEFSVDQAVTGIDQVGLAVNHSPAGTPYLVQRVGTLESDVADLKIGQDELGEGQAWEREALTLIASNVGVKLPAFPTTTRGR